MLNKYPLWKYVLIALFFVVGVIYAMPNLYKSDPAIQISSNNRSVTVTSDIQQRIKTGLESASIAAKSMQLQQDSLLVRFNSGEDQLKASTSIMEILGPDYTVAMNLAATTPAWLQSFNAQPMYLGLDLRGGLHFLMEVDTETVVSQALEARSDELRAALREKKAGYVSVLQKGDRIVGKFRTSQERDEAHNIFRSLTRELVYSSEDSGDAFLVNAVLSEPTLISIQKNAVQQNITTLRKRVNELGVAEPVIQQQGVNRIVVQLPGIQDSARAKQLLSATATLEFRMVDLEHSAQEARDGRVFGSRLYQDRQGGDVLLKKKVITTGEHITNAMSGFDPESGTPSVNITLDGAGGRAMADTTKKNLGKPMAVVFIEHKPVTTIVDGKRVESTNKIEEVINVATIRGVFSQRFQITGLDNVNESQNLALLLRAGALAAPIRIVEERTIGPSLGQESIDKGTESVTIGMILVVAFMVFYYRGFGVVANVALLMNVVMIVAVLSMLQATLTLPGIAGVVLTVGMAVDANVLIFERIREELRNGNTPQSSIHAGYEKALSTIADANITTLIAAVVLFIFGTGPIKGFAITLSIGIATSMFTAIMGTRAIINLVLGGKKVKKLSI